MPSATARPHDVDESEPPKPRRVSITRSPDTVRAIVRQLLEDGKRCLPEDLRARHHVEGGNKELVELIGEVRESLRTSGSDLTPRTATDPGSDLPVEFRPLEGLVRRAALTFVSRLGTEMQHHADLRIAAAEQDAAAREAALQQDLDFQRQQARESDEALADARAEGERRGTSLGQLASRLAEQLQHQEALVQIADDLRAALKAADERMRAALAEQDRLRAVAERADGARVAVEAEMRTLREAHRSQTEELRAAQAAVAIRTQEATTLQRMLDGVVATNAALVARLGVPVPSSDTRRTHRPPAKSKATTPPK